MGILSGSDRIAVEYPALPPEMFMISLFVDADKTPADKAAASSIAIKANMCFLIIRHPSSVYFRNRF
jgi:hypothetical protein